MKCRGTQKFYGTLTCQSTGANLYLKASNMTSDRTMEPWRCHSTCVPSLYSDVSRVYSTIAYEIASWFTSALSIKRVKLPINSSPSYWIFTTRKFTHTDSAICGFFSSPFLQRSTVQYGLFRTLSASLTRRENGSLFKNYAKQFPRFLHMHAAALVRNAWAKFIYLHILMVKCAHHQQLNALTTVRVYKTYKNHCVSFSRWENYDSDEDRVDGGAISMRFRSICEAGRGFN